MWKPCLLGAFALAATLLPLAARPSTEPPTPPKNIIFLIGDGMGVSQVSAAGAMGKPLRLREFPIVALVDTSSTSAYVTDSAAAGTALACGVRTVNGRLGLDAEGKPHPSLLHHAQTMGKATGIVVTCEVTHATPAAFVAHQPKRSLHEEIAQEFLEHGPDLFIGGGRQYFRERADQRNLIDALKEKGYFYASTLPEALASTQPKLAALIAPKALPAAKERDGFLPKATAKALELLSQKEEGFFLMVEGSQIDWAGHRNDLPWLLEEMADFDATVGVVLDFAKNRNDTLIVVTADHETGGLSLIKGDLNTQSVEAAWGTNGHSAVMVPLFATGAGAENFSGIYNNTDVFHRMLRTMKGSATQKP